MTPVNKDEARAVIDSGRGICTKYPCLYGGRRILDDRQNEVLLSPGIRASVKEERFNAREGNF